MFNVAVAADNPAAAANTATGKTFQRFHTPEHIENYLTMKKRPDIFDFWRWMKHITVFRRTSGDSI